MTLGTRRVYQSLTITALGLVGVATLAGCPNLWINPPDGKFFWPGVSAYETDARPTLDGGTVLVGYADNGGTDNLFVVRTDSRARALWQKRFSGLGSAVGQAVRETNDGGFVTAGYTSSPSTTSKDERALALYLLRVDTNGNKVWDSALFGQGQAWATSMDTATDGSFLVVGGTTSGGPESDTSTFLVRFRHDGTIVSQSYVYLLGQYVFEVICTLDGGYLLSVSQPDYSAGLVRYDAQGQELWRKTYAPIEDIYWRSVCLASDGGFVVAGSQLLGIEGPQAFLLKVDSEGNEVWEQTWHMIYGELRDVCPVSGGFAVTGTVWYGKYFYPSIYLAKFDADGNRAWNTELGGQFSNGHSVGELPNGTIMVAGNASSHNYTANGTQYRGGMYGCMTY